MSATATSDWPTPTVSTSTTSKPAASHSSIASRVRRATPPSVPPVGDGRMKASGRARELAPCGSCRRGSSRRCACSTGRRRAPRRGGPRRRACRPSASMNVDLPAPGRAGDPDARSRRRCAGSSSSSSAAASSAVVGPGRLDERDRPGQRPPVARRDLRRRGRLASRSAGVALAQEVEDLRRRRRGCWCRGRRSAATPASRRKS